jgi:hypothetical protein
VPEPRVDLDEPPLDKGPMHAPMSVERSTAGS